MLYAYAAFDNIVIVFNVPALAATAVDDRGRRGQSLRRTRGCQLAEVSVQLFLNIWSVFVYGTLHRDQLRRVSCEYVRPYIPGGKASLLLLQRERISLVPARASVCGYVGGEVGERKEVDAPLRSKGGTLDGSRVLIPGEGVESSGRTDDEDLLAGVCPKEGDESERFSRLVRANPR